MTSLVAAADHTYNSGLTLRGVDKDYITTHGNQPPDDLATVYLIFTRSSTARVPISSIRAHPSVTYH